MLPPPSPTLAMVQYSHILHGRQNFSLTPIRKETQLDRSLKKLYRLPEAQAIERQTADKDRHRQRLLRRYTRVANILHSPHPWPFLAPIRQYQLTVITYQLERNRLKHRHRAVRTMLQSHQRILRTLLRQHRQTSMKEVYKLFSLKPPSF